MRKCQLVERLLPAYIEGTLTLKQVRQLEHHLDSCSHCQEALASFERTIHLASNLPVEYPPPEAWEAFWPNLRIKIEQGQSVKSDRFPLWVKLHRWKIAGVAFALIAFLSLWEILINNDFMNHQTTAMDQQISQSVIMEIPVKQWQEQLNREIQSLDAPLTGVDEVSLVDEIQSHDTLASADIVDQLFQVIIAEIDLESFGDEALIDVAPTANEPLALIGPY